MKMGLTDYKMWDEYKDLSKKHHVMKKAKAWELCHAKRFLGEGPTFCCRKGKLIYMF